MIPPHPSLIDEGRAADHARWLSWLDPSALVNATDGVLRDERHVDPVTGHARVILERRLDPSGHVRVFKQHIGTLSGLHRHELACISHLMTKQFFNRSVQISTQSPMREMQTNIGQSNIAIELPHFGLDLDAYEGLSRQARVSPLSQVGHIARIFCALLRKMHQFHRCGLIHCDIKADNICVPALYPALQGKPPSMLEQALVGQIDATRITPIDFGLSIIRNVDFDFDGPLVLHDGRYVPQYYQDCLSDGYALVGNVDHDGAKKIQQLEIARKRVKTLSWRVDAYSMGVLLLQYTNAAVKYHSADSQQAKALTRIAGKLMALGQQFPQEAISSQVNELEAAQLSRQAAFFENEIKPGAPPLPYMRLADELEQVAIATGSAPGNPIEFDFRSLAKRIQTDVRPVQEMDAKATEGSQERIKTAPKFRPTNAERHPLRLVLSDLGIGRVVIVLGIVGLVSLLGSYISAQVRYISAQVAPTSEGIGGSPRTISSTPIQTERTDSASIAAPLSAPMPISPAAQSSRLADLQSFKDCPDCPEMVVIPSGSFMMGSPAYEKGRSEDESPQRRVSIERFAIGKYEVTQGQWKAVMGSNPSFFRNCGDNCPVENVSWNDAQAFIKRLYAKTGQSYRLPSEAEWEYAARADSQTRYSFGTDEEQLSSYAWYSANSGDKTQRAGQKQDNVWGLHDMHGNVWEWVQDCWEDNYSKGQPRDGSAHKGSDANCPQRVLRGGSLMNYPQDLRSALRYLESPDYRGMFIGLRLSRTAP